MLRETGKAPTRYLIGHYNPALGDERTERLRKELSGLDVTRHDNNACGLESQLEPQVLLTHLKQFLDPGEWFVLIRMSDGLTLESDHPT